MTFKRPAAWIWLFLVFTAIGIFFTLHQYLDDVTWRHYGTLRQRALEEMTGAYSAMILVPFLAWIAARFPFKRGLIVRALAGNVGGYIVYTIAHTTLNAVARTRYLPAYRQRPVQTTAICSSAIRWKQPGTRSTTHC